MSKSTRCTCFFPLVLFLYLYAQIKWWIMTLLFMQNGPFPKRTISALHLISWFLVTFILNKALGVLFRKSEANQNIPLNLYGAKIWCILLERWHQSDWVSFTCSTELKRSFPFVSLKLEKFGKQFTNWTQSWFYYYNICVFCVRCLKSISNVCIV